MGSCDVTVHHALFSLPVAGITPRSISTTLTPIRWVIWTNAHMSAKPVNLAQGSAQQRPQVLEAGSPVSCQDGAPRVSSRRRRRPGPPPISRTGARVCRLSISKRYPDSRHATSGPPPESPPRPRGRRNRPLAPAVSESPPRRGRISPSLAWSFFLPCPILGAPSFPSRRYRSLVFD